MLDTSVNYSFIIPQILQKRQDIPNRNISLIKNMIETFQYILQSSHEDSMNKGLPAFYSPKQ